MARLPDDTALGALEASPSNRVIATYDTSGYARGAAAMGDGAKELGAGIMTAGKALGAYAAQQAEAERKAENERKLEAARGQIALTAKQLARDNAIEADTEPVGLVARHVNEAAREVERVAHSIRDPQLRTDILMHRDSYVADVAQRAERQRGVLDAQGGVSRILEDDDGLGESALNSSDPTAMNRAAEVFHNYVDTLHAVGRVDDNEAADIKRNWATGIAEGAFAKASAADRVAAIAAFKAESRSEGAGDAASPDAPETPDAEHPEGAQQPAISELTQLARLLPPEVRERIDLGSQAEIGRTRATQVWEKAGQYEDAMEKASRGEPQPAPWRAFIEADPDLDDRTRARLLKQHDAMQQKLDRFWSIKAEYDKPNGRKFDVNDVNDRTFAEQMYTWLGGNNAALHAVVNRTEILPKSALARMQGDIASNDPARVSQGINLALRLSRDHPKLLALEDGIDDVQNAAAQFRHETARGATPDQAIRRIVQVHSFEYQKAWAAKRTAIDLDAEVGNAISPSDLAHLPRTDRLVSAVALSVYPKLVKERFVATGDVALAKSQARDQLEMLAHAASKQDGIRGGADSGE